MDVKTAGHTGYAIMTLIGQFWEHKDFTLFESTLTELDNGSVSAVVVDLSRLTFVSSQGLGRIVSAYVRMRDANRQLILLRPMGSVRETIDLAGFGDVMKICNTTEELQQIIPVEPGI
jgi:anti-anti-sigma factor